MTSSGAGHNASIKSLIGADFSKYDDTLMGTGCGLFKGDDYVGTACMPHMCGDEVAMLFLSPSHRKVFAAFKLYQHKIVIYMPIGQWPSKPKAELGKGRLNGSGIPPWPKSELLFLI